MTVAVYFSNERLFRTIEVHDVPPNPMLPTELEPVKLPCSQSRPQPLLWAGHIRTKPACEIEIAGLSSLSSGHDALPLLPPLTKGRNNCEADR